jgi:hypothetical protein
LLIGGRQACKHGVEFGEAPANFRGGHGARQSPFPEIPGDVIGTEVQVPVLLLLANELFCCAKVNSQLHSADLSSRHVRVLPADTQTGRCLSTICFVPVAFLCAAASSALWSAARNSSKSVS